MISISWSSEVYSTEDGLNLLEAYPEIALYDFKNRQGYNWSDIMKVDTKTFLETIPRPKIVQCSKLELSKRGITQRWGNPLCWAYEDSRRQQSKSQSSLQESNDIPCVSQESNDIPCALQESNDIPCVSQESNDIPCVSQESNDIPCVSQESNDIPSVSQESTNIEYVQPSSEQQYDKKQIDDNNEQSISIPINEYWKYIESINTLLYNLHIQCTNSTNLLNWLYNQFMNLTMNNQKQDWESRFQFESTKTNYTPWYERIHI